MKKVIRLTERDLTRIVKRVLRENIEFNIDDPEFGSEENKGHNYYDETTINGIKISVGFDSDYGDYTIYFPDIEFGVDEDVSDQVLRLPGDDPESKEEMAKNFFGYAKTLANNDEFDVYDVYKNLERIRDAALRQRR